MSLVRPANRDDHQKLSNLIFFEPRLHRHLDWRSPLDWLGAPFYWALEDHGQVHAALACPEEVPGIAWLRLFVYSSSWTVGNAWDALWQIAKNEIAEAGGAEVAVIAMQPWFQQLLASNGFENRQSIVMLEWQYQPWAGGAADGLRVRRMSEADLIDVQRVDEAAFDRLWQNSFETISRALAQSLIATVVESAQGIIGYQISTGAGQRAHLARLAVHPDQQGQGVGQVLLDDLFTTLVNNGIYKLSVNTQSDNLASLSLYRKMGFVRTGEQYPVYVFDIQGS